jgi:hypothetical protein
MLKKILEKFYGKLGLYINIFFYICYMENIKFIDAGSSGVFDTEDGIIEEGYVIITIDGEEIQLTIQQGEGFYDFLLDDMEYKPLMESLGIEFYDDEYLIGPGTFLTDLYMFYDSTTN